MNPWEDGAILSVYRTTKLKSMPSLDTFNQITYIRDYNGNCRKLFMEWYKEEYEPLISYTSNTIEILINL